MEMKLRHWLGSAAGLCAIIAVSNLPPVPAEPQAGNADTLSPARTAAVRTRAAARRIGRHLRNARRQLAVVEYRDSIVSHLSAQTLDPAEPIVLADEGFPQQLLDLVEPELRAVWGRVRSSNSDIRVVLDANLYTGGGYYAGSVSYLLPHATDGFTCVIAVGVGQLQVDRLVRGVLPDDVFGWGALPIPGLVNSVARGPCVFYAAFGRPSASVEDWLEQWQFFPARFADWDATQPLAEDRLAEEQNFRRLLPDQLPEGFGGSLGTRRSTDALACVARREDRCRAIMLADLEADLLSLRATSWGTVYVEIPGYVGPAVRTHMFGWETAHFLSDVIRDIGPEKFEKFWTSDLPVDQAFASVVGTDIGEWTADWLANRIGDYRFGPGISIGGALMVLCFTCVGVFAGAYVAERRKVGGGK